VRDWGLSASEDASCIPKTGLEMAPNFSISAQRGGEKGSKWLRPSKALHHCFLIGATVNEGINESPHGEPASFVSAVNGCRR